MNEKLQQAHNRMNEMGFNQAQLDFIFADWNNEEDHIDWLLNATKEEVEDWINLVLD